MTRKRVQNSLRFPLILRKSARLLPFITLMGAAASTLHAITWIGLPGEGNPAYWNDVANWDLNRQVNASDIAIVNNGFRATVANVDAQASKLQIYNTGSTVQILGGGILTLDTLEINNGGSFFIEAGGSLTAGTITLGTNSGNSSFSMNSDELQNFSYLNTSGFIKGNGAATIGILKSVINATGTNADFFQGFSTADLAIHDLVFNTGAVDRVFSIAIDSSGFLNKTGAGTLHLAQGGAWDNNLIVSQGQLRISGNTSSVWMLVGEAPRAGTASPGTSSLLIDNGTTTTGVVYVGNAAGYSGQVTVSGANTILNATNNAVGIIVGAADQGGLTIQNGATVSTGRLQVGLSSQGTLTLTDSYLSTGATSIGFVGNGTMTISGIAAGKTETWKNTGALTVGDNSTGILTLSNGAKGIVTGKTSIGIASTIGNGTISVSDSYLSTAETEVGFSGVGKIDVSGIALGSNESWSNTGDLKIGTNGTGTGTVTISNEAIVVNTGGTYVGFAGRGTMTVTDSYLSTMGTEIGFYGSGVGTVEISGISTSKTESWFNNGSLILGNNGSGQLTISNNAKVVVTGFTYVGAGGIGSMNISGNSTAIASGGAALGVYAAGSGSATIDNSIWEITGNLAVGSAGTGLLEIKNGGIVTSGHATYWDYIGYADYSATGSFVTIGGENGQGQKATWNVSGSLSVGGMKDGDKISTGTLTINDGGFLSAGALILGGGGKGNLYLNAGGIVATGSLRTDSPAGYSQANFNGGILRATQGDTSDSFIRGFSGSQLAIGDRGLTIETNYNISTDSASGFSGTGGINKTGNGNLTVNASTTYTGSTDVSGGGMWFNGAQNKTSTVSIAYGSVLGGMGSIDGAVYAKGTIAPGSARGEIGTLTVKGDVVLATTAILELVVRSANSGGYSALDLGGTGKLTIDSGAELVLQDIGYISGINDSFDIVTGLISPAIGSFTYEGQVIENGSILVFAGQTFQAVYGANSISLVAIPEPSTYALMGGSMLVSLIAISRRKRVKSA